ncbi:MAG: hypothetical protein M1608_06660 [Candidatus Omnitrophica bacterium]|nr:hypothetical protein [Candidatus Omnitrophota bacterium]
MNTPAHSAPIQTADLLITAEGKIHVHNLTPALAELLCELNPRDASMKMRAEIAGARPADNTVETRTEPP